MHIYTHTHKFTQTHTHTHTHHVLQDTSHAGHNEAIPAIVAHDEVQQKGPKNVTREPDI